MTAKNNESGSINTNDTNTAPALPNADSLTASAPKPSRSNWCPGSTASEVSASGAPRKTDGMMLRNVWVSEAETIVAAIHSGDKPNSSSHGAKAAKMKANVLVCIPGISPLITPSKNPATILNMSRLRFMSEFLYYRCKCFWLMLGLWLFLCSLLLPFGILKPGIMDINFLIKHHNPFGSC
jgi:hypothetical protein